jgi:adenine/guanine phosphoribosyltransferase-like PRPP-binding protein
MAKILYSVSGEGHGHDVELFKLVLEKIHKNVENIQADKIIAMETSGIIYGPIIALNKNIPF